MEPPALGVAEDLLDIEADGRSRSQCPIPEQIDERAGAVPDEAFLLGPAFQSRSDPGFLDRL